MFTWPPSLWASILIYAPLIMGLNAGARAGLKGVSDNWLRINRTLFTAIRGKDCLPQSLKEPHRTIVAALVAIVGNLAMLPYILGCVIGGGFRLLIEKVILFYVSWLDKGFCGACKYVFTGEDDD